MLNGPGKTCLHALVALGADPAFKAAFRLTQGFPFAVPQRNLFEITLAVIHGNLPHGSPCSKYIRAYFRFFVVPDLFPAFFQISSVQIAINAFRGFLPALHGFHHGPGTIEHVAACEDTLHRCGKGKGICFQTSPAGRRDALCFGKGQIRGLPDGHDHRVSFNHR